MNGERPRIADLPASAQPSVFAALGVVRPRQGSLGPLFAMALAGGIGIATAIGLVTPNPPAMDLMLLASLLVWQPAIEELLFRGVLQGYLADTPFGARSVAGFTAANGIASVAFAAIHLVHQPPIWALGAFFPSLLFGYFRDRTGSVWPPVLLHAAFNTAFFLG